MQVEPFINNLDFRRYITNVLPTCSLEILKVKPLAITNIYSIDNLYSKSYNRMF